MKTLKHNKLRNTGLIFEILCRKITHETLNPGIPQRAVKIIKKHFNKNSELLKELRLFQSLSHKVDVDSVLLVETVISNSGNVDRKQLQREQYNLIRDIKENYQIDEFFSSRVFNYKLLASIFKILEYKSEENPVEYVKSRQFISEEISKSEPTQPIIENIDPDLTRLSLKIIVSKFNEKYRELSTRQKKLLSKYINEDSNTEPFRDYVMSEIGWINGNLKRLSEKVTDQVIKIKLHETISLTQNIISAKTIKEEHLSSMLKYYELIEGLKNEN